MTDALHSFQRAPETYVGDTEWPVKAIGPPAPRPARSQVLTHSDRPPVELAALQNRRWTRPCLALRRPGGATRSASRLRACALGTGVTRPCPLRSGFQRRPLRRQVQEKRACGSHGLGSVARLIFRLRFDFGIGAVAAGGHEHRIVAEAV